MTRLTVTITETPEGLDCRYDDLPDPPNGQEWAEFGIEYGWKVDARNEEERSRKKRELLAHLQDWADTMDWILTVHEKLGEITRDDRPEWHGVRGKI